MTTNYKCIKYDCYFYFWTDEFAKCQITEKYIDNNSNCEGIKEAKNKVEEFACSVSNMIDKYNKLMGLEMHVRSNQEKHIVRKL